MKSEENEREYREMRDIYVARKNVCSVLFILFFFISTFQLLLAAL